MNDKNKKQVDAPPKEKNKDKALEKKTSTKKPFRWSILFIILALLIALASLAGAAYIWLQFEQYKEHSSSTLNSTINDAISDVNTKLQLKLDTNDVSQHVTPILSPIHAQLEAIEQNNSDASQARDSLSESTQKLFELYGRDKNGWQLAEVEYLLRIAQHRLVIENDFQGAEKTLKAADEKISEIADPGLLPVRVAISDERVLLQSRKRPDLVGIVLSLSRITKQIPNLDLTLNKQESDSSTKTPLITEAAERDPNAPWEEQVITFVKGLIKVEPLKKSISVPAVSIINAVNSIEENLKLAKWAVLERDQQQYIKLVKQSSKVFKLYFDSDNNYHTEINAELERLMTLEIRPELPDISGSLIMLKGIMAKKEHRVPLAQAIPKQVEESKVEEIPIMEPEGPAIKIEEEKGDSDE